MHKLFTLATGRSGTHLLAKLFNEATENAIARSEEAPAFLRRGYAMVGRDATRVDKLRFRISRDRHMRRNPDATWFIETNNRLFAAANKLIREVYPDALVYHIVRDGRDVVTSWLNRGRYFPADRGLRLTPEMVPGEPYRDCWENLNPLQKVAWNWVVINQVIEENSPDDRFRLEDLVSPPHVELSRLLNGLEGLHYDWASATGIVDERVNTNRATLFPSYSQWPEDWKEQFWEIAEPTMKRYGYCEDQAIDPDCGET